jgi:hypothetical protein
MSKPLQDDRAIAVALVKLAVLTAWVVIVLMWFPSISRAIPSEGRTFLVGIGVGACVTYLVMKSREFLRMDAARQAIRVQNSGRAGNLRAM